MPDIRLREFYVRPINVGLPQEEHASFKAQQNVEVLHEHLGQVYQRHHMGIVGPLKAPPDPAYNGPYTKPANQDKRPPINSPDHVLQRSQLANATRQVLGYSWYPTDHLDGGLENHVVPRVSSDWSDLTHQETPIPDKYLHEFNQMWFEDDEDNDSEQLWAALTPNAPWRNHLPLRPMYGPSGEFRTSSHYLDKTDIMMWSGSVDEARRAHRMVELPSPFVRPEPQSFFSWSGSSAETRRLGHGERLVKGFRESLGRMRHRL